jgi:hypothetical protein
VSGAAVVHPGQCERMPAKDLVYVKEKPGMGLGIFAVRDI